MSEEKIMDAMQTKLKQSYKNEEIENEKNKVLNTVKTKNKPYLLKIIELDRQERQERENQELMDAVKIHVKKSIGNWLKEVEAK